jgi:hypothetical protein
MTHRNLHLCRLLLFVAASALLGITGIPNSATAGDKTSDSSAEKTMRIVPDSKGVWFYEGKRKLFYYRIAPKSFEGKHTRAGYIHPLFGLDGETFTEEFPSDHRHHHGVFWAWHQLWVGDLKAGDPWITQDFLAVVRKTEILKQGPQVAMFKATVDWTSPLYKDTNGKPKPIIEEQTVIRVFRSTENYQTIDFQISLRALVPYVRIGGAENSRGYSGFTVRVHPPEDQIISDADGPLTEDRIGTNSAWADVSGTFSGNTRITGIAILSHPSLREFPPKWLLRHRGMQNVVYPGRHPIDVSQEKPIVLRHRLLIHRGNVSEANVALQQKKYENTD